MSKILDNVDLGRAFEQLKESLSRAEKGKAEAGEYGYAYAYGVLSSAIKFHIMACTGENLLQPPNIPAADPNDLKEVNI